MHITYRKGKFVHTPRSNNGVVLYMVAPLNFFSRDFHVVLTRQDGKNEPDTTI